MNTRVARDQTTPRWRPDTHAAQAERLLAHVWDAIRNGDRAWDDPDIATMLSAAEVHMRLADRVVHTTATPTGGSYVR